MTDATLPAPLTPADCDLQDFEFMPVMVRRLLKSETWSLGNGEERAAAVALWFESWHQVPAASLPDNDKLLRRLADTDKWAKVKTQALRGWVLCADGRLYHPVVAEKALEAWVEKLMNSISGSAGNAKRWSVAIDTTADVQRLRSAAAMLRALAPKSKALVKKTLLTIIASQSPPDDADGDALGGAGDSPPDSPPDSTGDRKGQGKGQGSSSVPNGTGGEAAAGKRVKSPEELAKAELWRAAVSLLDGQGMPEAQARAFFGKLAKDYPDGPIVTDALRNCIAEQPADARSWLTAECQRLAGTRKNKPRPTGHAGLADKNYSEGIKDGILI